MRALLAWLSIALCGGASLLAEPMEEAQRLFAVGRPAEAAAVLGKAMAKGTATGDAWFNLGQAYSAAGEPGRALWAWRQGLREAPRDVGLRSLAGEARRRTGGMGAHPLAQLTGWLRPEEWAGCLLAASAVLAGWMLAFRSRPTLRRQGMAWLAGLHGAVAAGWVACLAGSAGSPDAVVVTREAPVALAPVPEALPVATLPEATEVRLLRTFGEWSEVEREGRRLGWVRTAQVWRDIR